MYQPLIGNVVPTLVNCYNFLRTTDHYYDTGHNSDHCLKVWAWIAKYYRDCGSGLEPARELTILQAAALFHEQFDTKFGRNMEGLQQNLQAAMQLDNINDSDIEIVFVLDKNCSYKNRNSRQIKENLVGMLDLLCSADLAEAVGEQAIERSFAFHKKRIERQENRIPEDHEVWRHVIEFVEIQNKDGIRDRFEAIIIPEIRDAVAPIIEQHLKKMREIRNKFKIQL